MKISITADRLRSLVADASAIAGTGTSNVLPILSCLLFEAKAGKLSLFTTNLAMSLQAEAACDVSEPGTCAIPFDLLKNIVPKLVADQVLIEVANGEAVIKAGRFKGSLRTMQAKEYPDRPTLSPAAVTLDVPVFLDAVRCTAFAAAKADNTYRGAVLIEVADGQLRLKATDGYRMARWVGDEGLTGALKALVPREAMAEILKQVKGSAATTVSIHESGSGQLAFRVGDRVIATRLIAGEFPNIDQIIPHTCAIEVTVNRKILAAAVDLLLVMASSLESRRLILTLTPGELSIRATALKTLGNAKALDATGEEVGAGEEVIPVEYTGDPFAIHLNGTFFAEALRGFDVAEVILGMSGPLLPFKVSMPHDPRPVVVLGPLS